MAHFWRVLETRFLSLVCIALPSPSAHYVNLSILVQMAERQAPRAPWALAGALLIWLLIAPFSSEVRIVIFSLCSLITLIQGHHKCVSPPHIPSAFI